MQLRKRTPNKFRINSLRILLTGFSNIDNVYADNQQIIIAETVSRNKVKEKIGEIWFIQSVCFSPCIIFW